MKVEEESTKAGLCFNIKRTKIMTTEGIYNFNKDNEDSEIVRDFAYLGSVIHHNGGSSQEIKKKLKFERAAMEDSGTIVKSKGVLLEIKVKTIHTLVVPITMYGCGSGRAKRPIGGKNDFFF